MSTENAERQESYECSECGDTFGTDRGRDSHIDQVHGQPYHDAELLRELYVEKGLSSGDIADRFDVSYKAITDSLRRCGIDVRSTKATHRRKAPPELRSAEKLRALYHDEELTASEIADRVDVAQATVSKWLSDHDIETRAGIPSGEEHYAYKEDPSSVDYGNNWHRQSRRARDRDGHTCQLCGHEPVEGERALDVHHIRPLRTFDTPEEANTLNNLTTLCRSCHRKWEGIPLRPEVAD